MRYNADENALTAGEIVNKWAEKDLERIFREYGEERNSKRIARSIMESRERGSIRTSGELVEIINSRDVKTLARIFQALRIAVNDELENIKLGLEGAWDVIGKEGKIAAISFHSLEDRIVKNFFADKKKSGEGEILTKKPVTASEEEIKNNPKSRSAKLRVIRKLGR
jgi:16S rRNA (cytosine1402-N4)-methyltransferase